MQTNKKLSDREIKEKLYSSVHGAVYDEFKKQGIQRKESSIELLGCSLIEYKEYLERLFFDGMTWENYGHDTWHIDHIKPKCKFDLRIQSERLFCFNYRNTQPLWAFDNISKGAKYGYSKNTLW